jgi:hypothetical protein
MTDYSDPVSRSDIDHRLGQSGTPNLTPEQQKRISSIRESARLFARHILESAPPSWEKDEALHAIDNAASYAARSIARHE